MRFTTDDKHLIKWIMWVKKYVEKRLLEMFLAEDEVFNWWGKDSDQNISARSFNFFDLCSGVGIVWSTTTRTLVSNATAVTFSVKRFNPLKLYPLSGNIFRKWFASYFFICSRAFNNNLIFNGKSYCCNDTFTDVHFTSLLAKNI